MLGGRGRDGSRRDPSDIRHHVRCYSRAATWQYCTATARHRLETRYCRYAFVAHPEPRAEITDRDWMVPRWTDRSGVRRGSGGSLRRARDRERGEADHGCAGRRSHGTADFG